MRVTEGVCTKQQVSNEHDVPIRTVLLRDLSRQIDAVLRPVYTSRKIKVQLKPKEHQPSIVTHQNVVYYNKYGL